MADSWVARAWNVFNGSERPSGVSYPGPGSGARRPDRVRMIVGNEKSLLASIYTRLAVDSAMVMFRHCRVNDQDEFLDEIGSGLNDCLKVEANLDQNSQAMMLDIVMTMLDRGVAAIVPVDALIYPKTEELADIKTIRIGYVQEFMAQHVRVSVWNERTNQRQDVTMLKKNVGIVENPYYAVMNEPNSTLQRLNRKLQLLDMSDNRINNGKLDVLIQFPFQVRGDRKQLDAARRIEDLEKQLNDSQHGVAWIDATEHVIQMNRAVENKLLEQVQGLRLDLFSELGLTPEILNGTADADALVNYISRTLEPILTAVVQEMRRKFLTKTARTQGQTVKYFPNLFKMIPLKELAEIADKLTRNEIVTGNEFRSFLGLKPSKDPKADLLRNPNVPQPGDPGIPTSGIDDSTNDSGVADPTVIDSSESIDPNDQVDALDSDFEATIDGLMQSDMEDVMDSTDPVILRHVYDPAKRHQYYETHKKLVGRKKGATNNDPQTGPSNKSRAAGVGRQATKGLGADKTKAVNKLVNQAKAQLSKLTAEFRSWIDAHPKATDKEKEAQRASVLSKKNEAIKNLKTEVGKITLASSKQTTSPSKQPTALDGRHH